MSRTNGALSRCSLAHRPVAEPLSSSPSPSFLCLRTGITGWPALRHKPGEGAPNNLKMVSQLSARPFGEKRCIDRREPRPGGGRHAYRAAPIQALFLAALEKNTAAGAIPDFSGPGVRRGRGRASCRASSRCCAPTTNLDSVLDHPAVGLRCCDASAFNATLNFSPNADAGPATDPDRTGVAPGRRATRSWNCWHRRKNRGRWVGWVVMRRWPWPAAAAWASSSARDTVLRAPRRRPQGARPAAGPPAAPPAAASSAKLGKRHRPRRSRGRHPCGR